MNPNNPISFQPLHEELEAFPHGAMGTQTHGELGHPRASLFQLLLDLKPQSPLLYHTVLSDFVRGWPLQFLGQ